MRSSSYSRRTVNLKAYGGVVTSINENILPLNASPLCYNFVFAGGALKDRMGVDIAKTTTLTSSNGRHTLPELPAGKTVKSIHLYRKYNFTDDVRDDKVLVRASDNNFYETKLFETDTFHLVTNLTAAGKDCSVCYRYNGNDLFLLSSEVEGLYTYDGTTVDHIAAAPEISSMCVHSERVFATVTGEQNKVWFSSLFNPADWTVSGTGAGYIEFDGDGGKVIKVMQFLNYVYVFRDFGIERIAAYGSQDDFTVTKLYMSSARIYPDTIAALGDRIIFLAENGVYSCDGYDVSEVCGEIKEYLPVDKQYSVGTGLDGKYYLATALDYGADNRNKVGDENYIAHINNSIVVYDTADKEMSIMRGIDARGLTTVKIHTEASVLIAPRLDEQATKLGRFTDSGKYFGADLKKYWSTGYTDLGYPARTKTIRTVSLLSTCDVTLGVEIDGNITEFSLTGSNLPQKITVNKSGGRLRVYITTAASKITTISAPTVVVDIV